MSPRTAATALYVCLSAALSAGVTTGPVYAGTFTTLYNFSNSSDGGEAIGGVIEDATGTIYGETYGGGTASCTTSVNQSSGCGTVYSFTPTGGLKVLASFTGPNGAHGNRALVLAGTTLYGITEYGGAQDEGIVFSVHTDGTGFQVLHQFSGPDGNGPIALVMGSRGILFGITFNGGSANDGVLFSLTPAGVYTMLHQFAPPVSVLPETLVAGPDGSVVGGTLEGGPASPQTCDKGCGTVFAYSPVSAKFVILQPFPDSGTQGCSPFIGSVGPGPVIYGTDEYYLFGLNSVGFSRLVTYNAVTKGDDASSGPLYTPGGTVYGILSGDQQPYGGLFGTINGGYKDLYVFQGGLDGALPVAEPFYTAKGTVIGTTPRDGHCAYCGTIWEYAP